MNNKVNNFFYNPIKSNKINKSNLKLKSKLLGLNLNIKGRIGKNDRSRSIGWSKGKIKKNNLNIFTHTVKYPINTKTGVWMLNISLLRV